MADLTFPLINGLLPSWSSAEVKVLGARFYGFGAFNWSEKLDTDKPKGNGPVALGQTIGDYTVDADFEIIFPEYTRLLAKLGNSFGTVPINIFLSYRFGPAKSSLTTVEIVGGRIAEPGVSNTAGNKATMAKVKLGVTQPIKTNGLTLIDGGYGQRVQIGTALSVAA